VGPCHYGMSRPHIAYGGTGSNIEGSCEYIEQAVADNRRSSVPLSNLSTANAT